MRTIFLDTVGLVATWDTSDQWHAAASLAMRQLLSEPCRMVTTSFVILECANTAARTPYRADVVALRAELMDYGNVVSPNEEDERSAWQAYLRGEAGRAGIVDHVSFAVMHRFGLTEAFTNDRHFASAGFVTLF